MEKFAIPSVMEKSCMHVKRNERVMPKKTYKVLFFDLDGTLLDFNASEREALGHLLLDKGIEATEEAFRCYHQINDSMWKMLERGEITRERLQTERFERFFETLGIQKLEGDEAFHYRMYLSQSAIPIKGARVLLENLSKRYPLYLVSNGNTDVQYGRLEKSGFQEFFQGIFLSQEVGYTKPDKRFFDVCMEKVTGLTAKDILLIGDSVSSDMKGGLLSGIDTCWYHPEGTPGMLSGDEIPVTYEIRSLEELYAILEVDLQKDM